jgi:hypothetical protein
MNRKIAIKIKREEWEEKVTLGWIASLMEGCSPRVVFPLVRHVLGGFFGGGGREEVIRWKCV